MINEYLEQMVDDMGFEKFIETIVDSGVSELNMFRFIGMLSTDDGQTVYLKWLTENAEGLVEKFGEDLVNDEHILDILVLIINEFIAWLDNLASELEGVL